MSAYKVTLKSEVKHGSFYWVTTVNAASEDEAVTAAEHLFIAQMDGPEEWDFSDYDAEKL
jgi:hypothetical protein